LRAQTPIYDACAFFAGGHGTFSNLINNLVHVVMYFYYMMTAMGPQYQKYLWWKKHLTTIQLVRKNKLKINRF
jgi:elongation of very long chain fatty acids protein 7